MTRPVTMLTAAALLAVATAASAQTAREVGYSPQSIVALRAKLRYTTMVTRARRIACAILCCMRTARAKPATAAPLERKFAGLTVN